MPRASIKGYIAGLLLTASPVLALDFTNPSLDSRITASGGTNGTRVNSSGLIVAATTPRFDYDPVTLAAKGVLIEEARTNLCLRSAEFNNASWTKAASAATADQYVAPDGNTAADRLASDTSSAQHYARQSITYSATTYAISLYVKYDSYTRVYLRAFDGTSNFWATFNISTGATAGTVGSGVTSSIRAVGNGWYRIVMMFTAAAGAGFVETGFASTDTYSGVPFSGSATDYFALWGAQVEAGTFATSYIPTAGSTVTRSADSLSMTGTNFSSWYNAAEGTFVVEYERDVDADEAIFGVDNGTANERLFVSGANLYYQVVDGGAAQRDWGDTIAVPEDTANKVAVAYKVNDCNFAVRGTLGTNDTSCTIPTPNTLKIGSVSGASAAKRAWFKNLKYYNTRLSDAQLQALTA